VAHFCVNCGAPLVTKVLEGRELEVCPNDEFVLWRDPKVAAAVVVEVDGGIVLGRRAIEPGYGLWCLPGGFVNDDEDPAAAAVRECMEEICAAVEVTELLGIYHVAKTTAASIVGVAYRGRIVDGHGMSPGAEMLELGVFRPGELPQLAFPSHREVLQLAGVMPREPASRPSPPAVRPRRSSTR